MTYSLTKEERNYLADYSCDEIGFDACFRICTANDRSECKTFKLKETGEHD